MSYRFICKSIAFLLIICVLCSTLIFLSACKKAGGEEPDDASDTTYDMENLVPHDVKTVPKTAWGVTAFKVSSTRPDIASAVLNEDGTVSLTSYNPGKADILVSDCFDHSAVIHLVAAKDDERTISYEIEKFTGKFINAKSFGCIPGAGTDCSAALQKAIDKAAETGDTVYLFPGVYTFSCVHMKKGVTLKMYSGDFDARKGYTPEIAEKIKNGEYTVCKKSRLMNNDLHAYGHDGDSGFTVSGGVFDNEMTVSSPILLGLANDVTLENIIFKDIYSNHTIQYTGCTGIRMINCMFAGYEPGDTIAAETVQIEPTSPGAHNAPQNNPPQKFYDGEIFGNKDYLFENCYWGPSDQHGAPLTAIGHHGRCLLANCEDLLIKGCVFDGCRYCGIRTANWVNATITECTFRSNTAYPHPMPTQENIPAFIQIYTFAGNYTYTSVVDNKTTVTNGLDAEQAGTHNLVITDNKFILTEGTDKRVIEIVGNGRDPGLFAQTTPVIRQATYDAPFTKDSGYLPSRNTIENVSFLKNEITLEGAPTYKDYLFRFVKVYGLKVAGNMLNNPKNVTFSSNDSGLSGLRTLSCTNESDTLKIGLAKMSASFKLEGGDLNAISVTGTANCTLTVIFEKGGHYEIVSTSGKDSHVIAAADEGYVFDGWYDESGAKIGADLSISKSCKITAKFIAG